VRTSDVARSWMYADLQAKLVQKQTEITTKYLQLDPSFYLVAFNKYFNLKQRYFFYGNLDRRIIEFRCSVVRFQLWHFQAVHYEQIHSFRLWKVTMEEHTHFLTPRFTLLRVQEISNLLNTSLVLRTRITLIRKGRGGKITNIPNLDGIQSSTYRQ
jgi:hypothetical protein